MQTAVIGMGSIGSRHAENLAALGYRPVVYDKNLQRCSGWNHVPDETMLWEHKPEAVLICTPPDSHLVLAEKAIAAGAKGVFIEKPLALDLSHLQREACYRWDTKVVTMTAANWRFHKGPQMLKCWIDEGKLGNLLSARISMGYFLPDTRSDYRTAYVATTGVLLDVGSHAVDLAVWLLDLAKLYGAMVRSATNIGLENVDGLAELLLQHESGAVSSIFVNWLQQGRSLAVEVTGTKGQAVWCWNLAYSAVVLWQGFRIGEVVDLKNYGFDEMYRAELEYFLGCVKEGKQTCNSVSAAANTLNILLEARKCATFL